MAILRTTPGMLSTSFDHFRRCGAGRRECVVYWTGPASDPECVDHVDHPVHRSTAFGYEVESAWVTSFFLGLRRDHRAARLQAHTHPGRAGHSDTDDRFALVPAEGFISLVIPHFGLGAVTLERAVLVRMNEAGEWRPRPLWEVEAV